jgi:hypothetical protein
MMFERSDLLLVPFPFTDLSAAKRRLVLAVTAVACVRRACRRRFEPVARMKRRAIRQAR